ncbi:SWIM zinc finger family protein [Paenibacillus oryzisoli]|uniref:SWIM zinc finger family protein n=1 Tax=Paenibacillus oryzisoli TaxID=1850517 RepID=UPI003D2781EC
MHDVEIDWLLWNRRFRSYFDSTISSRGWKYYKEGRVRDLSTEGASLVKAMVAGSSSWYRVTLDMQSFQRSTCSCPYGLDCKHMAAVLFELAEQSGVEPGALRDGTIGAAKEEKRRSAAAGAVITRPQPSDPSETWQAYFDQQYGRTRILSMFSVIEVCERAWRELHAEADSWPPVIRGLYDSQVALYIVQLCGKLAGDRVNTYDYDYNAGYYVHRVLSHAQNQLEAALHSLDVEQAQASYAGHLKTLAAMAADLCENGPERYWKSRFACYKLVWSRFFKVTTLADLERERLRAAATAASESSAAQAWAVLGLAHLDMLAGEDENVWERIETSGVAVQPEDWFEDLSAFADRGDWDRLVKWLRWLLPDIRETGGTYLDQYLDLWEEAAHHRQLDQEINDIYVKMLPASYSHYAAYLLDKQDYLRWADLALLLRLLPDQLDAKAMKRVEQADARVLLPIYHQAVETLVQGKNRTDYKQAIKYLKKMQAAYRELRKSSRFQGYLEQLNHRYARYRAFQEELQKGKLLP